MLVFLCCFSCSVLGPALTFRIGPNPKNVSTADLVQVAGKRAVYIYLFIYFHLLSPLTQWSCWQPSLRFISFSRARPLCHRLCFSKWEHRLVSPDTVDRLVFILFRQTPVPKKIINSVQWQMTINYRDDECGAHTSPAHTHTHTHTHTHARIQAQTAARREQLATYPVSQSQITLSIRWFIEAKVSWSPLVSQSSLPLCCHSTN